ITQFQFLQAAAPLVFQVPLVIRCVASPIGGNRASPHGDDRPPIGRHCRPRRPVSSPVPVSRQWAAPQRTPRPQPVLGPPEALLLLIPLGQKRTVVAVDALPLVPPTIIQPGAEGAP